MAHSTPPPLLAEVHNASSASSRAHALRLIKNDMIGHDLRKRAWVSSGIMPALANVFANVLPLRRRGSWKSGSGEAYGRGVKPLTPDENALYLQATVVIGILAKAGLTFVQSVLEGNVLSPLLTLLCSETSSPALVLAILKTLVTIADQLPPAIPTDWQEDQTLSSLLYSEKYLGDVGKIICQSSPTSTTQQSVLLAVTLLIKTCFTERQKDALTNVGILEALATKLSSFVVSQGLVLPNAEFRMGGTGPYDSLPPPAPSRARLAPFLHLVAIIIDESKMRTEKLLSSPALVVVFPKPQVEFCASDVKKTPWSSITYFSGTAVPRHTISNPIDFLLPSIPVPSAKLAADQANFPPLSSTAPISKRGTSFLSASLSLGMVEDEDSAGEEDESPVVAWLIYLLRSEPGFTRLMAAKLLIILCRQGFVRKSRETMFSMLLVPLIVRMLDRDYEVAGESDCAEYAMPSTLLVKEEAPGLLAMLVRDSQSMQKSAVDSDAIKRLVQLLKESFDTVPPERQPQWQPRKAPHKGGGWSVRMSAGAGPSPMVRHLMRHRANVLKALSSLAAFDDEYRIPMCELGVVPYIIDSLKPYTSDVILSDEPPPGPHHIAGNPSCTLVAACAVAQALTRSVSVLRTSLIDADIASPLFHLLTNNDLEVRVAATKVVCNLALTFSPMRDAIVNHDIIKTLCRHAHSAHPMLRLDSIWALKHLVLNSSNDLKVNVMQELRPIWIKHLIATDPEDITPGIIIGMEITHGFGEDVVPRLEDGSVDCAMADSLTLQEWNQHTAERRAQALSDHDYNKHTVKHDIMIQAQVLDLVRNLILGDGADEMVDYVFKEMNQNDFFAVLAQRLRPHPSSRQSMSNGNKREAPKSTTPPTEIINSVLGVIVHIAAALPKYRSLLVGQTEIMKLILPMFGHPNRKVRSSAVWITANLMYHEDSQDKLECRRRAKELERLGFVDKVMALKDDVDLDVKETTKTALTLFADLLHG